MDLREIARLRLRNQRVSGARLGSAEEVVGWLGCVQSQEYPLAKWTLGMRAEGLHDANVDAALFDGRILRTHILRPTWHFVLPADIRWMMALTRERVGRFLRSATFVMPPESEVQRAFDVIRDALSGGRRLARDQLRMLLQERGVVREAFDMVPILIRAELDLVICSGGLVGKAQTYALVDERAPAADAADFDRDWALGELTRRFFTSHGPATIADFTWWSSLTVADTRRGIEVNGARLERLDVDGTDSWWAGDAGGSDGGESDGGESDGQGKASPTAHFMQGYDEYIVAYRSPRHPINVSGLMPPSALSRPPFLHAIILDTQLVGWWRRRTLASGGGYLIETRLQRALSAGDTAALDGAVERYSAFVGLPVGRE